KLRRLVDDDDRERIVADRLTVRFDAADVAIDVLELADLVQHRLDTAAVEELEAAAAAWCGTPLEGLELPAFHDYSAWYMGQRERAIAQQTRLLSVLLKRLAGEPERAVQRAHTLVRIAPYDEQARAELIRLLVALGRPDDAERQYALGSRLLKEAGATPTGALHRALRGAPGQAATPPVRRLAETRCSSRAQVAAAARAPVPKAAADGHLLIGRDAELARLRELMAESFGQRRCRAVLVRGDPGIGKSRLLDAAATLAREAGAVVLEAEAHEAESIRPFALFVDALRKLEPRAAAAVFTAPEGSASRDRLFERLGELVAERAAASPVVLK